MYNFFFVIYFFVAFILILFIIFKKNILNNFETSSSTLSSINILTHTNSDKFINILIIILSIIFSILCIILSILSTNYKKI